MPVTYNYKNNLYLNITNRCSNKCTFCMRNFSYIFLGYDLKVEKEHSKKKILKQALKNYSEQKGIVFCGIGEPLIRLDDVLWICQELKKRISTHIRIDTNGHVKLLYPNRDIAKEFFNNIDSIFISLNAEDEEKYNRLCRPKFPNAYNKMLEFAKECTKYFPVTLSAVDLPAVDVKKCNEIANNMGAEFRVRKFGTDFSKRKA